MKRTKHSGCLIFLNKLDWLNFALDTDADFIWLNTELISNIWMFRFIQIHWYKEVFLRPNKYAHSHSLFDE